jgi:hypothetical protein
VCAFLIAKEKPGVSYFISDLTRLIPVEHARPIKQDYILPLKIGFDLQINSNTTDSYRQQAKEKPACLKLYWLINHL